jgi:predicted GNAT family acetyltransferase
MDLLIGRDPAAFLEKAAPFLSAEPFSANVISVWLEGVLAGRDKTSTDDAWIIFEDAGTVAGAAMWTPPHVPFLPRLPTGAARQLGAELGKRAPGLAGVNGVKEAAFEFAAGFGEVTGRASRVLRTNCLYVLGELHSPTGVEGVARTAGRDDLEIVASWWEAFEKEALGRSARDDTSAARRVAAGDIVLWLVEGEPVSLAGYSAPACGVSRIGPVYTPEANRGRGYGSAVTATASVLARSGRGAEHVVLYADLANPTSNHVYNELGYRPDHHAEERVFSDGSSAARATPRRR